MSVAIFGDVPNQITLIYYLLACYGAQRTVVGYIQTRIALAPFFIMQVFDIFLSGLSCGLFIYMAVAVSNIDPKSGDPNFRPQDFTSIFQQPWLIWIEFSVSILYFGHLLLSLLTVKKRSSILFNVEWYIDITTSFVGIIAPIIGFYYYGVIFLRAARFYYLFEYFRPWISKKLSALTIQLFSLVITIAALVFIAAGFIFVLENSTVIADSELTDLLLAHYFVVVTLSTVGYGDVTPNTPIGRIATIILIFVGVAVIPAQASKLASLVGERQHKGPSRYRGRYSHVVLFTADPNGVLHNFLNEFYHPDHGTISTDLCVMIQGEEMIGEELRDRMNKPNIRSRVTMRRSIQRTKIEEAEACFLIGPAPQLNPSEMSNSDADLVLICYAIKRFCREMPLYAQIQIEAHKAAAKSAGVKSLVCVEQLRLAIIAQGCLCPGFIAMMSNLVHSRGKEIEDTPETKEYGRSIGYEIYVLERIHNYVGVEFHQAVMIIYEKFGCLLIGLGRKTTNKDTTLLSSSMDGKRFTMTLNPQRGTKISEGDVAIVICQDSEELQLISEHIPSKNGPFELPSMEKGEKGLSQHSIYEGPPEEQEKHTLLEKGFGWKAEESSSEEEDYVDSDGESREDDEGHSQRDAMIEEEKQKCMRYLVEKREKDDATIDRVDEKGFEHFVVVVGSMNNQLRYASRVRRFKLKKTYPIILLMEELPDDTQWDSVSRLPEIYLMQGSPTNKRDLYARADALKADSVVILRFDGGSDAKSIMIFRMVKRGRCKPIIQLEQVNSAAYLGSLTRTPIKSYEEARDQVIDLNNPYHAAGQVYYSNTLASLIVQSYFNPYIIRIVEDLTSGCLFCISIKKHCPQFADLMSRLLSEGLILWALRRKIPPSNLRYIILCPRKDLVIRQDDVVIVQQNGSQGRENERQN
ncbi:potassium channel subfamily T member 1-like [Planoprotostelium fungivorum]|uniref:Potassium channel subfamily T member 1-like n=1 Tax=Planoprotostelium fungivorum TaxID=1890364 RepID=A0A2P6NW61_9EUKA|nr:potassium channel subfamily T member 1-like [Planoprotostelium fungivorum]